MRPASAPLQTTTVLMLSHPDDVHVAAVGNELTARGVPYLHIDIPEIPHAPLTVAVTSDGITAQLGQLDLADVSCVWHRRPSQPRAEGPDVAEQHSGIGGVLAALPHLNHPTHMARASLKPLQLIAAHRAGLTPPPSLITTNRAAAERFAAGGPVLTKPMSPQVSGLVTDGDRSTWRFGAHLTQRRIAKSYNTRVTAVDSQLFGVRIDSPHLDWRTDINDCEYQLVDVPRPVAVGIDRLLSELQLRFAALDFVVDADGTWWFLEANPNGQWLWLEHATGAPIARAIADALSTPDSANATN